MRARLLVGAVAGLSVAAAGAPEPAKAPVSKAQQPADKPVAVVVAAVEEVPAPVAADEQPAAAPAKRARKARVTSCRCGDQTKSDD